VNTFEDEALRGIYEKMVDMFMSGEHIDQLTISDCCDFGMILDDCVDTVPSCAYIDHYINILKKREVRRCAIEMGIELIGELKECEDPEAVVKNVQDRFSSVIDKTDDGMADLNVAGAELINSMGKFYGVQCSIPEVNGKINGKSGYVVEAGTPSTGKTALMLQDLWEIQKSESVVIFSLEMQARQLVNRMACRLARVEPELTAKEGAISGVALARYKDALEIIKSSNLKIYDGCLTNDDIKRIARYWARRGVKVFGLDYLQRIELGKYERASEARANVDNWVKSHKSLVKEYDLKMWQDLCQLSRSGNKYADRTPPPPTLQALKESSQIEQEADMACFLYKPPDRAVEDFSGGGDWEIIYDIQKNRNGSLCWIRLRFIRAYQEFIKWCEGAEVFNEGEGYGKATILERTN